MLVLSEVNTMKDMKKVRLVKSRTNKLLTGVCGGIGELIGIDRRSPSDMGGTSLAAVWRYSVHPCSGDYSRMMVLLIQNNGRNFPG